MLPQKYRPNRFYVNCLIWITKSMKEYRPQELNAIRLYSVDKFETKNYVSLSSTIDLVFFFNVLDIRMIADSVQFVA